MIGIIILNYNTWDETKKLIKSIKNVVKEEYRIYVIDNCSPVKIDNATSSYFNDFEELKVVFSKVNNGYSAGNNIGIKLALEDDCDFLLICNSDILFEDSSVSEMKKMLVNLDIGIVGPQIYNTNGSMQPFHMLCKLTAIGKLKLILLKTPLKKLFSKFENSFIGYKELEKPKKVFGVSGCCFMMTNKCARFLYPLDEKTFLYEEEYIIGSRLEYTDMDIYIIPDTKVIHAHGISTKGMNEFSYKCFVKSEQYYLKYYLGTIFFLRIFILCIRKISGFKYYKKSK